MSSAPCTRPCCNGISAMERQNPHAARQNASDSTKRNFLKRENRVPRSFAGERLVFQPRTEAMKTAISASVTVAGFERNVEPTHIASMTIRKAIVRAADLLMCLEIENQVRDHGDALVEDPCWMLSGSDWSLPGFLLCFLRAVASSHWGVVFWCVSANGWISTNHGARA